MRDGPIGVIDSGVGGITVWKEIARLLSNETIIYIGDSRYAPYGILTSKDIYLRVKDLVDFLVERGVKMVVVACNTMTVSCLDDLRREYPDLPIVGTVPVVKVAASESRNKKIGVMSTTYTARSDYQKRLIEEFADGCQVRVHGTDSLVPFIERGEIEGDELRGALRQCLDKFKREGIDVLVLGCTHFPLLRREIVDFLGKEVKILDSGAAIARQVKRILINNKIEAEGKHISYRFYTTGRKDVMGKILKRMMGEGEKMGFVIESISI